MKKKRIVKSEERLLRFNLFHNGLFKQKVIPNKKKEQHNRKKFQINKEMSGYLIAC